MIDLRQGQWGESGYEPETRLSNLKGLLTMDDEVSEAGWSSEPARLFAIDTAMLVLRRHWDGLAVVERSELSRCLQDARRLVIDGNCDELGYLQNELERHLAESWFRDVWLTALNALLPCPFRAAEATVKAAVETAKPEDAFIELLRQRLIARLDEGILMRDETSSLLARA